jgi:D-sedoheptulose 7-phosphate isomerase
MLRGSVLNLAPTRPGSHPTVGEHFARLAEALARVPLAAVERAVDLLLEAQQAGRRVYVMGNGGSAATATHLACDLTKTAHVPGCRALRAFALADNPAILTAWANDTAYERIFAAQLAALAEPGDVAIAVSASGSSANVVAGLHAARAGGLRTIGLLGFDGGLALDLVDLAIHVPCDDYGLVEDVHQAIGHAVAGALRRALSGSAPA